jgi:hypothetical protein
MDDILDTNMIRPLAESAEGGAAGAGAIPTRA